MLNNLLVCRTLLLACTLALVLVFAPATSQSQPSESKCGIASEICYDDVVLKEAVRIAQWGYWTYCWVNLRSGIQIAVVDARTVEQCRHVWPRIAREAAPIMGFISLRILYCNLVIGLRSVKGAGGTNFHCVLKPRKSGAESHSSLALLPPENSTFA